MNDFAELASPSTRRIGVVTSMFLDIETIGTENESVIAELAAEISHPGNISKAETIAAWEAEKKPALIAEAVCKTAFDGGLGRVICVGYALDDEAPQAIIGNEPDVLQTLSLVPVHVTTSIVGHNVAWDIRFLWQRYIVNAIPVPKFLAKAVKAKPWEVADTMLLWNTERDKKISLDKLCRVLRIQSSKSELDGSKVWTAYREGRIDEIAAYCLADVRTTRECYRRMT